MNHYTFTREVEIQPTVTELGQAFCALADDDQAYFFRLIAIEMRAWGGLESDSQLLSIAKHLRSDDEQRAGAARAMLRLLAEECGS